MECSSAPIVVPEWYETHRAEFSPPICNRIMHKKQMTVMFVGGPNRRRDFHLDRGSEFFFQMRGNMKLPIILPFQKLHIVEIKEGQVFLLPSCVPHSPQRPEDDSLGLVVERDRAADELDGLRYFEGFDFIKHGDTPEKLDVDRILWERFFNCGDLAQDLVPVVKAFAASEEARTNAAGSNVFSWGSGAEVDRSVEPQFPVNSKITEVPEPFYLSELLSDARLADGSAARISVFGDKHPDKELVVELHGDGDFALDETVAVETLLFQEKGECRVTVQGKTHHLKEKGCYVIPEKEQANVVRPKGSVGLFVQCHPRKNEQFYGYEGFRPPK